MKKKTNSFKVLRRVCAVLLVAVLLAGTYFVFPVDAKKSFDYIEGIKDEIGNGTFNIIEIVPEKNCGTMGYYAAGSEPCSYWTGELSDKNKTERASYVNTVKSQLTSKGILGSSGTPLINSNYTEIYPWDYDESNSAHAGATRIKLVSKESTTIKGNFEKLPDNPGDTFDITPYSFNAKKYDYKYNPTSSNALYTPDVLYYKEVSAASSESVYYKLTFTDLDKYDNDEYDMDNFYVYENVDDGDTENDSETQPMQVVGVIKNDNGTRKIYDTNGKRIGLDIAKKYYIVAGTSSQTTYSSEYTYVGVLNVTDESDGYELAGEGETGYYEQIPIEFNYIGEGSGNYKFTANSSATEKKVYYSIIYVTSFYKNSNWFSSYVLDENDDTPFPIYVESLTPSQLNKVTEKLYSANLIVISSGLSLENSTTAEYSTDNDISENTSSIISKLMSTPYYTPVIIDNSIKFKTEENTTRLSQLINTNVYSNNNNTKKGFYNNVYIYDAKQNLASSSFITSFSSTELSLYSAVKAEIDSANSGRTSEEKISTIISPAACVRHILNFMGTETQKPTPTVRVLEIQPYTNESVLKNDLDKVRRWLSYTSYVNGIPRDNTFSGDIEVTTMAAAEFVGKIDDIIENYDIVYIGSNTKNMGLNNNTDYNDNTMDGMYYTNVGDTNECVIGEYNALIGGVGIGKSRNDAVLAGILFSDYEERPHWFDTTKVIQPNSYREASGLSLGYDNRSKSVLRYSGDDITPEKCEELIKAADAGMPIIVEDNLVLPGLELNLDATLKMTTDVFGATFSVQINGKSPSEVLTPYGLKCSYEWYENGNKMSSTAESIYVPYEGITNERTYYCKILLGLTNSKESRVRTSELTNVNLRTGDGKIKYTTGYHSITVSYSEVIQDGKKYMVVFITDNNNGRIITGTCSETYQWYQYQRTLWSLTQGWKTSWKKYQNGNNSNIRLESTDGDAAGKCACKVTISGNEFFVSNVVLQKGGDAPSSGNTGVDTKNATVPTYDASVTDANKVTRKITFNATPNETKIDNTSNWYKFLDEKISKENVFSATEANNYSDDLFHFVNYSNPEIKELEYDAYDENDDNCGITAKQLKISFKLTNDSDNSTDTTRYYCYLYVDINGDGNYDGEDELIEDALITNKSTKETVTNGSLQTNGKYTLYKKLTSKFIGIVPWKIKIIQKDNPGTHTSITGYSYIKPEADELQELKVLQIVSKSDSDTVDTNLVSRSVFSSDIFNQFGTDVKVETTGAANHIKLAVKSDYELDIRLVSVSNMEAVAKKETGLSDVTNAVQTFVDNFDMLIIGFGDLYYKGVTESQALAIERFITANGGKPILYTHDATSYFNDFIGHSSDAEWLSANGTYLNRIVRSKVGLDRYGASYVQYNMSEKQNKIKNTNQLWGFTVDGYGGVDNTAYSSYEDSKANNRAAGITGIYEAGDYSEANMLKKKYAVSYVPGSMNSSGVKTTDYRYVHGFTKQAILNFDFNTWRSTVDTDKWKMNDGYWENKHVITNTATIVNRGQITEYPFHIDDTISIKNTHEQYYQLNVNNPEVKTWYCLSGGNYSVTPNDCANNYYIYTVGNVTYTGAGHTNTFTLDEAKLFLNTIVVSYKSGTEDLNIAFRRVDDEFDISYCVVRDMDSTGAYADEVIKFKVSDPNVPSIYAGADYEAVCYYKVNDTQKNIGSVITGTVDGTTSEFTIPASVLQILFDGKKEAEIYIRATIPNPEKPGEPLTTNEARLTLRKLELLTLS